MGVDVAEEEQFGPYLVYERLGVGGMATVHRALERGIEGFERVVALKRLLPHLAEDASFIKSFVREAKLASLLNHVNIVQIFELGRVGTAYFISMEYIDGRDVRRVLRHARKVTGPPAIHATVGMLLQLCEALDYAHHKVDDDGHPLKLIHRDISPSNLLITSAGHLKIIDFGIAKAQSSQLRTQTGRVKGKLAYMAPEAIAGKDLDARSDLWAVGVIAHELLTARPLFASKNEYQTLLKVQRGEILPPSTFNQACPPELDAIVARALARDPDERYANAGEMRDALIDLRIRHALQTGYREVAGWLDWAFAVEAPIGDAIVTPLIKAPGTRRATPPAGQRVSPTRADEDEAVEVAWGGAEPEDNAGPIVLDDIPDVSGKHLAFAAPLEGDDDIPTPQPSHGATRPSVPSLVGAQIRGATPVPVDAQDGINSLPSDDAPPTRVPTRPSTPPPSRPTPQPTSAKIPSTKPGFAPPRRPSTPSSPDLRDPALAIRPPTPRPRSPSPAISIGQAIVDRDRPTPRKAWKLVVFLLIAGGAATAVTLYATRGTDAVVPTREAPPEVVVKRPGKLTFIIEPSDATITIAGMPSHQGAPWSTEVPEGDYNITIERPKFKPYLANVSVDANEKQNFRWRLDPLDVAVDPARVDATLILGSTPSGLEVVLDGVALEQRTPLRVPLAPGPHAIVLRENGVEVWKQALTATPSTSLELAPDIIKLRERARVRAHPATPTPPTLPPSTPPTPPPTMPPPDAPVLAIDAGLSSVTTGLDHPANTTPSIVTLPTTRPPLPKPSIVGPLTVAPNTVTKLSGETPRLATKQTDLPAMVSAKVCIDVVGKVTTVDPITRLERHAAADLVDAMRTWRYAPYKHDGAPVAACFVVSFKSR
ncbi:MAG: serine/threonine protein kinase [Proteobacteria bacterium]|nr:serine/threonine protein kinase [Pseudomonadota bacterium]